MEKIFLIDDNEQFLSESSKTIKNEGYKVYAEANEAQAYLDILKIKPNLIFVHISTQSGFGMSLVKKLKESCPEYIFVVIFVNQNEKMDEGVLELKTISDGYMQYPACIEELPERIKPYVDHYRTIVGSQKNLYNFKHLFKNIHNGLILFNKEFEVTEVNVEFSKILSYKESEIVKSGIENLFHPEDRMNFLSIANQLKKKEKTDASLDVRLLRSTGTYLWINLKIIHIPETGSLKHEFLGITTDISLTKQLEEKYKNGIQIIESTTDAFIKTDPYGKITFWNKGAEQLFGYTSKEVKGLNISLLYKNEDIILLEKMIKELKEKNEIKIIEVTSINKEKKDVHVLLSLATIKDNNGEIVELLGITKDVTQLKKMQQSLIEKEACYRELINTINSGVAIYKVKNEGKSGSDYIIQDFNKFALEHEQFTLNDVIGKSLKDLRPNIDEYGLIQRFRKVWLSGVPDFYPAKIYKDDKYENYYENRIFKLPSGEIVAVYDDVTERKRQHFELLEYRNRLEEKVQERTKQLNKANDSLVKLNMVLDNKVKEVEFVNNKLNREIEKSSISAEKLRYQAALLENVSDAIVAYDNDFIIQSWNRAAEILFQVPGKKALNKNIYAVLKVKHDNLPLHEIYDKIKSKGVWKGEEEIIINDNLKIYVLISISNVLIYQKEDIGYVAIYKDITQIKKYQERLKASLIKEKELNELKSTFVSLTSHQFRTPLSTIRSSMDLLELYLTKGDCKNSIYNSKKHIKRINDELLRMNKIMDDVLILGRYEAQKTPYHPTKTDLVDFCRKLLEQSFLDENPSLANILTIIGNPYLVIVDSNLMQHIISNLLSNAIKYSKDPPEIILEFEPKRFIIRVLDKGIGIPPEEQKDIFQLFFRASNTYGIQGTGLGLVIVKQFIELHGGTISFKSKENEGTEFILTFPVV